MFIYIIVPRTRKADHFPARHPDVGAVQRTTARVPLQLGHRYHTEPRWNKNHPITAGVEEYEIFDEQHISRYDLDQEHLLLRSVAPGQQTGGSWVVERNWQGPDVLSVARTHGGSA